MQITDVSAFVLRLPEVTDACDGSQDTALVRITTDEGIVGWGEVDSCPTVVKAIIDAPLSHKICNGLANILAGKDPLLIDDCMQAMYEGANYYARIGVGAHAMAGSTLRSGTSPERSRIDRFMSSWAANPGASIALIVRSFLVIRPLRPMTWRAAGPMPASRRSSLVGVRWARTSRSISI